MDLVVSSKIVMTLVCCHLMQAVTLLPPLLLLVRPLGRRCCRGKAVQDSVVEKIRYAMKRCTCVTHPVTRSSSEVAYVDFLLNDGVQIIGNILNTRI